MSAGLRAGHPKQKLLFFVAQDIEEGTTAKIRSLVEELGRDRSWLNGPPRYVHEVQESGAGWLPEDLPLVTLGGYVELYTAHPPWQLPRDIDRQHLEEATFLVDALRKMSRELGLAFELELDGTHVGRIEGGSMDRLLADAFLGEWRRAFEATP